MKRKYKKSRKIKKTKSKNLKYKNRKSKRFGTIRKSELYDAPFEWMSSPLDRALNA